MTAYTRCPKHNILYQTGTKCPKCRQIWDLKRKNEDSTRFYQSKAWKIKRREILNYFCGIDIWILGLNGKISACKPAIVHHIVEYRINPELALDDANLVVLSQDSHATVHKWYDSGHREEAVAILKAGIDKFRKMRGE